MVFGKNLSCYLRILLKWPVFTDKIGSNKSYNNTMQLTFANPKRINYFKFKSNCQNDFI